MVKRTKKPPRLGQHFLTSRDIARQVAEAAGVACGDTVLEVGPGRGILTQQLLTLGAHVAAVEKDPTLVKFLQDHFMNEIQDVRFKIYEGDIRDQNILESLFLNLESGHYKVAANIPYYITGELIRLFLTAQHQPTTIALLVQKEVARRITDVQKESLLSLSVKVYGTPRYVRTVRAGSFSPPPKVDSAILAIEHISRSNFSSPRHEERFFELLHIGFGQKRKTLLGNLAKIQGLRFKIQDKDRLLDVFAQLGLNPKVRAEDVPLATWLQLTRLF